MPEPDPRDESLGILDQVPARSVRFRIGVGGGIVLLLAALVVSVTVSMLTPRGATENLGATVDAETRSGSQPRATGARGTVIFVHVLGGVRNPGLYELSSGSRVVDVVSAAGGFTDDAETSAVNLARVLADGEQLSVLRVGEMPVPVESAPGSPGPAAGGTGSAKVSINSASVAELTTLPQVGPATAQKIVDWRASNGPFSSVSELMNVAGIGEKTFDGLKDLITV